MANKEGVIFIEEPLVMGEVLHKEVLENHVAIGGRSQAKTRDDTPGVGIDNKDRFSGRVKDYRVRSLIPYTVNG